MTGVFPDVIGNFITNQLKPKVMNEEEQLRDRSKHLAMMAAVIYAGMYQSDTNQYKDDDTFVRARAHQANLAASEICHDLKKYGFDF